MNSRVPILLVAAFVALSACKSRVTTEVDEQPLFQVRNGAFDVTAIITYSDSAYTGMPMGTGTISFDWEGDSQGSYSVTGDMAYGQKTEPGVAAVIQKIFDVDYQVFREGMSLLGFKPVGNNKADIFVLGTKIGVTIDSIRTGETYGIGPLAPFNGLFFRGLDVNEFWAGQKNFLEIADSAYVLTAGIITIDARENGLLSGSFTGTTDINQPRMAPPTLLIRRPVPLQEP